jgi:hypothetical protein
VKKAGFNGVDEIQPVNTKNISRDLLVEESEDTIVTLLCLRSITEPEKNITATLGRTGDIMCLS